MIDLDLGLTRRIIEVSKEEGLNELQIAYVLATAYWETAKTVQPVREAYYLGSKAEAYRKKLKYYPYYGRGLVQLTWDYNYKKASSVFDKDFLNSPDLALDPEYSVRILVRGMKEGWFTGKKLSNYIVKDSNDYRGARRIVNGLDRAEDIRDLALVYLEMLKVDAPDVAPEVQTSEDEPWFIKLLRVIIDMVKRNQ